MNFGLIKFIPGIPIKYLNNCLELRLDSKGDVIPPSFDFSARLATPLEVAHIVERLKTMRRQTMNFRTMQGAGAIVLLDSARNDKLIGWHGFYINQKTPDLTEKFSLHLDEEYRTFLLGIAMETVLYGHLNQQGITRAMIRINRTSTPELMEYRIKTGIATRLEIRDLNPDWVAMCGNCELYKSTCNDQVYFQCDVQKGLEFGLKRIGLIADFKLPVQIRLVQEKMRQKERVGYVAKWAA